MLPVQSEPIEQQGVVRYHAQGFSLPAKEDAAGGLQAAAILVRPLQPVKLRTTVLWEINPSTFSQNIGKGWTISLFQWTQLLVA